MKVESFKGTVPDFSYIDMPSLIFVGPSLECCPVRGRLQACPQIVDKGLNNKTLVSKDMDLFTAVKCFT
jgi:hypothetical protein